MHSFPSVISNEVESYLGAADLIRTASAIPHRAPDIYAELETRRSQGKSVACGSDFTVVVRKDDSVLVTGGNFSGQLGLMHTKDQTTPVQMVEAVAGVEAVACGGYHTALLKKGGTVWVAGSNTCGQLGLGHTNDQATPVQMAAAGDDGAAVVCGWAHTALLKKNGSVWVAGSNTYGQLGLGHTNNQTAPVQMAAAGYDVAAVVCGSAHTALLKKDGTVWVAGSNTYGQLGLGHTNNQTTPVQMAAAGGVEAVACGGHHTALLKKDGTVWMVGRNTNGQLGLGHTNNQATPEQMRWSTSVPKKPLTVSSAQPPPPSLLFPKTGKG
jgi:alpha-tubulin suppressor-like RCC1 family protein